MPQLPLPLTFPEIFSADNFFVSECNKEAYETVLSTENWVGHTLYLHGEKLSGKSHLAYIFAQKNNAIIISAQEIKPETINSNCVVENAENCPDERALLHLFNHCKDIGVKLLMTSALLPNSLPFTLPDLTSRLRACQIATIHPPDDILIASVMRKQFSDRQLLVDDEVIYYIVSRMERTLANVKTLVEKLDTEALLQKKNITIPFVKQILGY
jgi:chromosomal replication initiation ATPase DnaA